MKRWGVILLICSVAFWLIWTLSSFFIDFESLPILKSVMQAAFCAPDETFQHDHDFYTTRSRGAGYRVIYVCAKEGVERAVDTLIPVILFTILIIISIMMIARGEKTSPTRKTKLKRDTEDDQPAADL